MNAALFLVLLTPLTWIAGAVVLVVTGHPGFGFVFVVGALVTSVSISTDSARSTDKASSKEDPS